MTHMKQGFRSEESSQSGIMHRSILGIRYARGNMEFGNEKTVNRENRSTYSRFYAALKAIQWPDAWRKEVEKKPPQMTVQQATMTWA
ncbi:hypothetical protein EVAR_71979_1 [Eumeta japonica]|uniref:Uncharacterized protein n=1 Tax=Eumeta variegata TaxID=151549 RepID=A0A4C1SLJ8_EUMVA|nr:hypothetical protein EVAR_71979_1 [Eumeta japonica]